jgi:hypothetical protein
MARFFEGYQTARVPFRGSEAPAYVDVPVPGETFVTPGRRQAVPRRDRVRETPGGGPDPARESPRVDDGAVEAPGNGTLPHLLTTSSTASPSSKGDTITCVAADCDDPHGATVMAVSYPDAYPRHLCVQGDRELDRNAIVRGPPR